MGTVFIAAAGFFELYAFRGAPSEHSLLNAEGMVALAFLAILLVRSGSAGAGSGAKLSASSAALIVCVTVLAFLSSLHSPFLYDDYTHITDAAHFTFPAAMAQFGPVPQPPGLFFRPFGFFLYWLNYLWADQNPVVWHAVSLALHALAAILVLALGGEIGLARPAALAGALVFAVAGTAAETVAWIDARFDLMATCLVLASILLVCRYLRSARVLWLVTAMGAGAAAMLTKETAFCLPLLIACLAFFRGPQEGSRIWSASAWSAGLAAALFAYRWWALGGIGGYRSPAGAPAIAQLSPLRSLNGLFLREWAILFFPFNWSLDPGTASRLALALIPLILAVSAFAARASSRRLLGCLAFVFAASLPVQHLLLMGTALSGTRNLYLVSVGWALLCALVLEAMNRRLAIAAACLLVAAQWTMLEHNLKAWRSAAQLAQSVCTEFGRTAAAAHGMVVVSGLPDTRSGAVFLHNGFPQCVEINSGFPAARIFVRETNQPHPAWATGEFVWNAANNRLEMSK